MLFNYIELRPTENGDISKLIEIRSKPELDSFWVQNKPTPDRVQSFIQNLVGRSPAESFTVRSLSSGAIVGAIFISNSTQAPPEFPLLLLSPGGRSVIASIFLNERTGKPIWTEVMTFLDPSVWGLGIAVEIKDVLLKQNKTRVGPSYQFARVRLDNEKSRKSIEKAGFKRVSNVLNSYFFYVKMD